MSRQRFPEEFKIEAVKQVTQPISYRELVGHIGFELLLGVKLR